jgi:AcrR family transcriptional regulator
MVRSRPPDRLRDIVDAATRVFLANGYKRTLMSDVAAELELSAGTLYRYVESKEALFHLCVLPDVELPPTPPPVPTPRLEETLDAVRARLGNALTFERLARARRDPAPPDGALAELHEILLEHYRQVESVHVTLALVERSADDLPGLRDLFYVEGRRRLTEDLADHLRQQMAAGGLRPVDDPMATALLFRESLAWFAYHRHFDFDGRDLDDPLLPDTVVDHLVRGMDPR